MLLWQEGRLCKNLQPLPDLVDDRQALNKVLLATGAGSIAWHENTLEPVGRLCIADDIEIGGEMRLRAVNHDEKVAFVADLGSIDRTPHIRANRRSGEARDEQLEGKAQ